MSMTIQGFSFDWIQFPYLKGLIQGHGTRGRFDRFNCVDNRFGVYFFIHVASRRVDYAGKSGRDHNQARYLKYRISQHFQPSDMGGNFRHNWLEQNGGTFKDDFGPYIENLQLITLSTDKTYPDTSILEILKEIERVFLCEFKPVYNRDIPDHNDPFCRLTDDEQNRLTTCDVLSDLERPQQNNG